MHLGQEHVHEVELHWHLRGILRYIELSSFSVLKIRPPKCPLLRGFNVLSSQPAIQHTSSKCCLSPVKDPRFISLRNVLKNFLVPFFFQIGSFVNEKFHFCVVGSKIAFFNIKKISFKTIYLSAVAEMFIF